MKNFEVNALPGSEQESKRKLFELFEEDIRSVIQKINGKPEDFPRGPTNHVFIDENGIKLSNPSERLGKHARVYFLDLEKDGQKFECVLRNEPSDAEDYKKAVEKKPVIKKYLPLLYGVEDGWVIMERLHGIELGMDEKLKDDSFRAAYAKESALALYTLASNDVYLKDAVFWKGHNVIAQEDGSVKFIEQVTLAPEAYKELQFTPNELISEKIFDTLKRWENRDHKDEQTHTRDHQHRYDFQLQFLFHLFTKINPEDLFIRYRYLKNSHEYYQSIFDSKDESKKPILPWPNNAIEYPESGVGGLTLNQKFIEAIQNHDIEQFTQMIYKKEAVILLEDTEENRVVLS